MIFEDRACQMRDLQKWENNVDKFFNVFETVMYEDFKSKTVSVGGEWIGDNFCYCLFEDMDC